MNDSLEPQGTIEKSLLQTGEMGSSFANLMRLTGRYTMWICVSCHRIGVGISIREEVVKRKPKGWVIKEVNADDGNPSLVCDVCTQGENDYMEATFGEPEVLDFSDKEE